jgi:hypothetical protein
MPRLWVLRGAALREARDDRELVGETLERAASASDGPEGRL